MIGPGSDKKEAVKIASSAAYNLLNSKAEHRQPALLRVGMVRGDDGDDQRKKQATEKRERRINSVRPLLCILHHCNTGRSPNFSKTWVLRGDQDGGSSGHLMGRRRPQVSEKATGDLHTVLGETFPQAFSRIVKAKVF